MRRRLLQRDYATACGLTREEVAALPPAAAAWLVDAVMSRDEWVAWPLRMQERQPG